MNAQAYPLHWPEGWPRTERHKSSQFRTSLNGALKNVQESLRKFGEDTGKKTTGMLISSNVTLMDRRPVDSGVAIYFSWDGMNTCIAVDQYPKVEDNLQAIHHVIEAKRTEHRHGGLNIIRAAFRGYAALPPPGATKPWRDVLGDCRTVTEAKQARNHLAKAHHSDTGGNDAVMAAVNIAYAHARQELAV